MSHFATRRISAQFVNFASNGQTCIEANTIYTQPLWKGGGGHLTHVWVQGCRWRFEALTLLRTKITLNTYFVLDNTFYKNKPQNFVLILNRFRFPRYAMTGSSPCLGKTRQKLCTLFLGEGSKSIPMRYRYNASFKIVIATATSSSRAQNGDCGFASKVTFVSL